MRAVAGLITALMICVVAESASAATLSGRVRGLPPRAEIAYATVRAVALGSGRIAAVGHLRAGARYQLTVPRGRYLLVLGAMRNDGSALRAVSQRMTAGRAASSGVRISARQSSVPASTAAAGPVVTMGEFDVLPVDGATTPTTRLGDLALSKVFGPLSRQGVRFVDQSPKLVAAALREEQLSREGRSDTPVRYRPLQPRFEIAGGGVVDPNGVVEMAVELRDLTTGHVIARRTTTARRGSVGAAFAALTSEFVVAADAAIERAGPAPAPDGVLVDLEVTLTGAPRGGRVTASPPGRAFVENDPTPTSYQFRAPDGTAIALTAAPDAGFYFEGWSEASRCGTTPMLSTEPEITCTVVDPVPGPGDELFEVAADAAFQRCPRPGTLVVGSPNAVLCPGVRVFPAPAP